MKVLLICPDPRPAVPMLAETVPLAVAPILGKSLLVYWVEHMVARGARQILVLASDRPDQVRAVAGDGSRWGVHLDIIPTARELAPDEAREQHGQGLADEWLAPATQAVVAMDCLPGLPERKLFRSYADWYLATRAWLPWARTPDRIGLREIQPGVWAGLHLRLAPSARLRAPCWLGDHVVIGPRAAIGPGAILDDRVFVEAGARILRSIVGPETFVGELTLIKDSLTVGNTLINWRTGSAVRVPDAFLLGSLREWRARPRRAGLLGRLAALLTMGLTAPVALAAMACAGLRLRPVWRRRLAIRPCRSIQGPVGETFTYYELASAGRWLRRWPQLWSVVRGDLAWVGNRPLAPAEAAGLGNNFERLWLTAPAGLISLADVEGCPEGLSEVACAHASFYAARADRRLNRSILSRALTRPIAAALPLASWKELLSSGRRLLGGHLPPPKPQA